MGKTDTFSQIKNNNTERKYSSNLNVAPKSKSAFTKYVDAEVMVENPEESKRETVSRLNKNNLAAITLLSDEFA